MALLPASKLSRKGAKFIGEFEGYRADWYRDPVGILTIGFGHTGPLPPGFKAPLTRADAERLLIHDAASCAAAVRAIRPRVWRQSRFDALVSFAFNLGPAIFSPERTIGRAVRRKDNRPVLVAHAMLLYDKAGSPPRALPGLTRRRRREARLWLAGKYEA